MLHNLKELQINPAASGMDVLISGHWHRPKIDSNNDVLYLNPGGAGPHRLALPIALATVGLYGEAISPHFHEIAP